MKLLRVFGCLALALALAGLSACNSGNQGSSGGAGGGTGKRVKVGFVSNNPAEFWTIAEAGTKKAAEEFNAEVYFKRPQDKTAAEQKSIIEDLLTRGVQAIAISVIDPDNQTGFLDQIVDRDVSLITQDNDAPNSKRVCYIGTDNYAAGREVGKLVKDAMPQGGKVAIFVGQPDPLNARQRRQGVMDELAGEKDAKGPTLGKYQLLGTYYDQVDNNKAKQNAADVLTKNPDEANLCMVGLWAYNPPAILSAVQDARREGKVKICAFDEQDNTLLGIKSGAIYATVVQQPFEFGYQSVKLMTELARGDRSNVPADGIKHVPHKVIKKDNVEEFHQYMNKLLGKG